MHEVSEVLGNSSISITKDVYGHLSAERKRAAADAMATRFGAAPRNETAKRLVVNLVVKPVERSKTEPPVMPLTAILWLGGEGSNLQPPDPESCSECPPLSTFVVDQDILKTRCPLMYTFDHATPPRRRSVRRSTSRLCHFLISTCPGHLPADHTSRRLAGNRFRHQRRYCRLTTRCRRVPTCTPSRTRPQSRPAGDGSLPMIAA